jgi:levansucrase
VTTAWTREHLLAGDLLRPESMTPVLADPPRMLADIDVWDMWPVRTPDGAVADVCGAEVWVGLTAPSVGHPGERHNLARLRLLQRGDGSWSDLGPLFSDGASPGSREWAGSTVLHDDGRLSAFYTAAGTRGGPSSFQQRLFVAEGRLSCPDVSVTWGPHTELVEADGIRYTVVDQAEGEPGFIKAFRDPTYVEEGGSAYLLFTASVPDARSAFNGCVGAAVRTDGRWTLLDPLVTAVGVNNELERPHVVHHGGLTYLFFSTQRRTFDPAVAGPTGLYGFVGESLLGQLEPLNGTGLVLQNPPEEPFQAYSWLVLPHLRVSGFVDAHSLDGRHPDDLEPLGAVEVRRHFGGTITPWSRLVLDGSRSSVVPA